ncbi:uncharacterized protein [Lolium perenne]|uniref:uncharacterized protein n=1 Tax=Lolium perenne TaxID=4522 RepID=UPI003A9925E3
MRAVQITNIIHRPLELSTGSYSQWRNRMELTVEEHGVLHHLTDDPPLVPDQEWRTVDLILKRWIYASVSPELTNMIMDPSCTRQGNLSIAQFRARIKTVADALRDADQPPTDDTLVTILTRGLNDRNHVTAKILNSSIGKITFDEARNMLLLDEIQARGSERIAS